MSSWEATSATRSRCTAGSEGTGPQTSSAQRELNRHSRHIYLHKADSRNRKARVEQGLKCVKMNATEDLNWVDSPSALNATVERLKAVKELEAKYKKENKTKKVEVEGRGATVEKLVAAVNKFDDRIKVLGTQAEDREGNKEVALGTSKINYIDPRLTVVFAKKFDVPIEKFFSKTLRDKFRWAIKSVEDDDDWTF